MLRELFYAMLFYVMLFGAALSAQEVIPPGTILPVELNSSLRSDKMHAGEVVKGRIMQDVPIEGQAKIRAGAKIIGKVVDVISGDRAEIALRFDTLKTRNRRIALTTDLRALATAMDVEEALIPTSGPDRGTSEADWVTEQIGGETVYHGSVVTRGSEVVGNYVSGGVLVRVSAEPQHGCRSDAGDRGRPQALWVFSSDACGLYHLHNLKLEHAGRTDPVGEIRLQTAKGPVNVPSGSGMLLRVLPARQVRSVDRAKQN